MVPFSPPHGLLLSVAGMKNTLLPLALLSSADLSAVPSSAKSGPPVWKDANAHSPLAAGNVGLPATLSLGKRRIQGSFKISFCKK